MVKKHLERWPVRPRPLPQEGLMALLVRLAHKFHFPSVGFLCGDLLGRTGHVMPKGSKLGEQITNALEVVLDLPERSLSNQWKQLVQHHRCLDHYRIVQNIEISEPRVCPSCILENRSLKYEWQVAHTVYCHVHRTELLGLCPNCSKRLTWSGALLAGCPACGKTWVSIQKQTMPAANASIVPPPSDLDRIYRAFQLCAAPGTVELRFGGRFHYNPAEHQRLMKEAYAVVYSVDANRKFAQLAANIAEPLGPLASRTADHVRSLVQSVRSDACEVSGTWTFEDREMERPVGVRNKVLRARVEGRRVAHTASAEVCASLMGVSHCTFQALVDGSFIVPALRAEIARDRLFQLADVAQWMGSVAALASARGFADGITVTESSLLLRLFGQRTWNLLAWCAKKRMDFEYRPARTFAESIVVSRAALVSVASERLVFRAEYDFSRQEVLGILNINDEELDTISSGGLLPSKRWNRTGCRFHGHELLRFLERYQSARREAAVQAHSVEGTWDRMLTQGFKPVIERVGGRLLGLAARPEADL